MCLFSYHHKQRVIIEGLEYSSLILSFQKINKYEFDYSELPWDDNYSVDFCSSCDAPIHLVADVTVKHKIAKDADEIDFVVAI